MEIDQKLEKLGLQLPKAPEPIASYIPAVQAGGFIVVSGQLPLRDGQLVAAGKVPSQVSLEQAQQAARQCALNALAIVQAELGGNWEHFGRIVRLGVFVQSDDTFTDQAKVANGASELMQELFGENGRHARAAVGVNALPMNAAVEIEMMVQTHMRDVETITPDDRPY